MTSSQASPHLICSQSTSRSDDVTGQTRVDQQDGGQSGSRFGDLLANNFSFLRRMHLQVNIEIFVSHQNKILYFFYLLD